MQAMDNSGRQKVKQHSSGSITFFSSNLKDIDKKDDTFKDNKLSVPPFYSMQSRLSTKLNSGQTLDRSVSATSSAGNSHQIKDWINQKSLSNIRDHHSAETYPIRHLYNRVLNNEENFVKGIQEFLDEDELLKTRRKELLHKKWHEKVYVPLRKEVENSMDKGFDTIDRQRRKEYSKYLKYKNRKGDVFLDVVSNEEYNPFALYHPSSPIALHAKTGRLDDPLLTSDRQRLQEERTILRCETGEYFPNRVILARRLPPSPLVPLGRAGTKCSTWLSMTLRNMDSPHRTRSRQRMIGKSNQTDIDFATWSSTTFEPEVTDRELRIQKKRRFKIPSTMPGQALVEMPEKSGVRFANPPVTSTA